MNKSNDRATAWHRLHLAALAAGVSLCLVAVPMVRAETTAPLAPSAATPLPSFSPLVKKIMPAVVNVTVTMKADAADADEQTGPGDAEPSPNFPSSPFDEFLHRYFQQQQQGQRGQRGPQAQRMALGSGFIIDPSGYVVTNNHVVANAGKVTVIFQDNSQHPAKIIGRDPKTDLALLKIDAPQPLPYVAWGDSNHTQVGDWVLAVGNPFGLGGTVSTGIISARGRDIHAGPYDDFLQIDASINRGNSGGPTFTLDGKVIGINTAIYSPNGGSVGIGFAIPSDLARPVIEQLRDHGKVERGWLGVQIQEVTPEIAKNLGLPQAEGALVADVTAGGPAAKAGLKQGDVITDYDGHAIAKLRDLPLAVAETKVGEHAEVKLWREGHETTLNPTIAAMPANPEKVAENTDNTGNAMGLSLESLTQERREQLHVPKDVKGVVVAGVADSSPFAALGVTSGDVIQSINRQPVATPAEASAALDQVAKEKGGDRSVLLLLNRHGINEYVAMTVEDSNGNG